MGVKEELIRLEDMASRQCTLTLVLNADDPAELYVENCRSISHCDDNFITLCAFGKSIRVSGAPLVFDTFGAGGVKISGKIQSLDFEDRNEK